MDAWDALAPRTSERAADLDLIDEAGRPVSLSQMAAAGPLLALVFGGPRNDSGMRLLLDYRDATMLLRRAGVNLCGIANAEPSSLAYLRSERGVGFPLLSDPDGTALSRWGMLDGVGLFLLDRDLTVRQRARGDRAGARAMLNYLRRGGPKPRWTFAHRLAHFFHALQHALRPRRFAR